MGVTLEARVISIFFEVTQERFLSPLRTIETFYRVVCMKTAATKNFLSFIIPTQAVNFTNTQYVPGLEYKCNRTGHTTLKAAEKYAARTAKSLTHYTGVEFTSTARAR